MVLVIFSEVKYSILASCLSLLSKLFHSPLNYRFPRAFRSDDEDFVLRRLKKVVHKTPYQAKHE